MRAFLLCTLVSLPSLVMGREAAAGDLDDVIQLLANQNSEAGNTQSAITKLDQQERELEQTYEAVARQADSLEIYVSQLEETVGEQKAQMASLEDQIDRVTDVGRRVVPLIDQMADTLEAFVKVDVPFLLEERQERLQRLRETLSRADVTDAEKYRVVLEAYQIENDYGRTIEAYEGRLPSSEGTDAKGRVVNFLRFGRAIFAYATLDGQSFGVWNQQTRSWESLPDRFGPGITRGLRIARKQSAPDLVFLPVPAPTPAKGAP